MALPLLGGHSCNCTSPGPFGGLVATFFQAPYGPSPDSMRGSQLSLPSWEAEPKCVPCPLEASYTTAAVLAEDSPVLPESNGHHLGA